MNTEQQIRMALAYKNISQAELARLVVGLKKKEVTDINSKPAPVQNLNKKIKRNTLSKEDLEDIAAALGGVYVAYFEFPDGTIFK